MGLAVVLLLTIIVPQPQPSEVSSNPSSGFYAEESSEIPLPENLLNQFLFADLDAQQSYIAEARLLDSLDAQFSGFFAALSGAEERRGRVRDTLLQAYRELTDYRLAQSMGVIRERHTAYRVAKNYIEAALKPLLTPSELVGLSELLEEEARQKFYLSFGAQVGAFARKQTKPMAAESREALVREHFRSSYELDNPLALGSLSEGVRLQRQIDALERTRDTLRVRLEAAELAAVDEFLLEQRRQLIELTSLTLQ